MVISFLPCPRSKTLIKDTSFIIMPMKISTKWDNKHAWLFLYNVVLTADSLFFIIVPSLILGSVTAFAPFLLSYFNLIFFLLMYLLPHQHQYQAIIKDIKSPSSCFPLEISSTFFLCDDYHFVAAFKVASPSLYSISLGFCK